MAEEKSNGKNNTAGTVEHAIQVYESNSKKLAEAKRKELATTMLTVIETYGLNPLMGHINILGDRPYITNTGLLKIAHDRKVKSIEATPVKEDWEKQIFVFKCKVVMDDGSTYVAEGDADPSNTTRIVQKSLRRMAETRAVNRALRLAINTPFCSAEEIDVTPDENTIDITPATENQINYIKDLVKGHIPRIEVLEKFLESKNLKDAAQLSKQQASEIIEKLKVM
jgi:hypothetical protein